MIGVVVPTRNAAQTLGETLSSLRRNPVVADIVVVDSGSSDATQAIARENGVRVIDMPVEGMYAAINLGCRNLTTEWLAYLNADDVAFDWGRSLALGEDCRADVVYGTVDFIDAAGRFVHSWTSARPSRLLGFYRAGVSPLLQQGTLFRNQVFQSLGGFDARLRLVGDADFFLRALLATFQFARLNNPSVAAFRLHADQLSRRYAHDMRAEHRLMLSAHGISPSPVRMAFAAASYRLTHLRQYGLRALRRHDLTGRTTLAGSYSITCAKP
jgi:glycosyltransferase involved in cell wall biosynthesis